MTEQGSCRDRSQRDKSELPEVTALPQARKAERLDDLHHHHQENYERQYLCHQSIRPKGAQRFSDKSDAPTRRPFDQPRRLLSKCSSPQVRWTRAIVIG